MSTFACFYALFNFLVSPRSPCYSPVLTPPLTAMGPHFIMSRLISTIIDSSLAIPLHRVHHLIFRLLLHIAFYNPSAFLGTRPPQLIIHSASVRTILWFSSRSCSSPLGNSNVTNMYVYTGKGASVDSSRRYELNNKPKLYRSYRVLHHINNLSSRPRELLRRSYLEISRGQDYPIIGQPTEICIVPI